MSATMQAIIATGYGSPDVYEVQTVAKPIPKENEILVKVYASTVTAAHTMMRTGYPLVGRLFTGLRRPNYPTPGTELAGVVEAVGSAVQHFRVGDAVFGATDLEGGCNAEYTILAADGVVALQPANVSHGEVASLIDGALTAMHFLRDLGEIQPGQRVLINGASGSVGSAAVQLANYFGAEVTAVCSGANVEMVRALGADHVIDYTQTDFTAGAQQYDIIFDAVGKSSFPQAKAALTPNGIYLTTVAGLPAMTQTVWTSLRKGKKAKLGTAGLRATGAKIKDLHLLKTLLETKQIKPVIDRCYSLAEVPAAHHYVETGRKRGNVVITVAQAGGE